MPSFKQMRLQFELAEHKFYDENVCLGVCVIWQEKRQLHTTNTIQWENSVCWFKELIQLLTIYAI